MPSFRASLRRLWSIHAMAATASLPMLLAACVTPAPSRIAAVDTASQRITCGPKARKGIPDTAQQWMTWDIPEYQDRQRFVQPEDGEYGPIACVVAADRLDTITLGTFTRPSGALVAMAYVDGASSSRPYANLRMTAVGYYCVILRHLPQPPNRAVALTGFAEGELDHLSPTAVKASKPDSPWEGFIVPATPSGCSRIGENARMQGMHLIYPSATRDMFPAAARFMVDNDGLPGIGVQCDSGWCALGATIAKLPQVVHDMTAPSLAAKSRRVVFGWYDDQRLAHPGTGGLLPVRPSQRASVVPHRALATYKIKDFKSWTQVATVRFAGQVPTKYRSIWQFLPGRDNIVELMYRGDPNLVASWAVRINGVRNDSLKVKWTDHGTPMFLAATARWVWKDTDDGLWTKCDWGCCEVEPYNSTFENH